MNMLKTVFRILKTAFVAMALIGGFTVFLLMLKIFISNFIHLRKRYIQEAKERGDDL